MRRRELHDDGRNAEEILPNDVDVPATSNITARASTVVADEVDITADGRDIGDDGIEGLFTFKGQECVAYERAFSAIGGGPSGFCDARTQPSFYDFFGDRKEFLCPDRLGVSRTKTISQEILEFCSSILTTANEEDLPTSTSFDFGPAGTNPQNFEGCGICPLTCMSSCMRFVSSCCPAGGEKPLVIFDKDVHIGTTEFTGSTPSTPDTKAKNFQENKLNTKPGCCNCVFSNTAGSSTWNDPITLYTGEELGPTNGWPDRTYTGQSFTGSFISQYGDGLGATYSISNAWGLAIGWGGGPIDSAGQTRGKGTGLFLWNRCNFLTYAEPYSCNDELTSVKLYNVARSGTMEGTAKIGLVFQDSNGWHIKSLPVPAVPAEELTFIVQDNSYKAFDPADMDQAEYNIGRFPSEVNTLPPSNPSFKCIRSVGFLLSGDSNPRAARAYVRVERIEFLGRESNSPSYYSELSF